MSILSRKLGADFVIGTDIDSNAIKVSKENCTVNKLCSEICLDGLNTQDSIKVFEVAKTGCGFLWCNVLKDQKARELLKGKFDLITANILADVIIPLAEITKDFLKPNGYFISSGIINSKADEVEKALLSNNWKIIEKNCLGDWFCYIATR